MLKTSVIIAAAGMSRRMGLTTSKQLLKINSKSVIEYSLDAFSASEYVDEIIIVTKSEDIEEMRSIASAFPKVRAITLGGAERFDSVSLAFAWVSEDCDIVAIHDAARPLITTDFINTLIEHTSVNGAVCPVGRVTDTIKHSSDGEIADDTFDRNTLFTAQTPQLFKREIYKRSLETAKNSGKTFTDDTSIVEFSGYPVYLIINDSPNLKITRQCDVPLAKLYLKNSEESMKIGHGYDVHKLVENRDLILGGVKIEYTHGLLGHSDADVLVHAVMDALIGAMGLGDIGKHFPDTDEKYKGISSILLLRHVKELLDQNDYTVGNIDATVIAQKPKLLPFIPKMRENIAEALDCPIDAINVKATTEEILAKIEKYCVYAYANLIEMKPFVVDYLKKLKNEGCKLYVLTASPHAMTDVCLKHWDVYDMFDIVWSSDELGLPKSDPAIYTKAASVIGVDVSEIAFYDDNLAAITASTEAGLHTVAVYDETSSHDREKLQEIASEYINSFKDLL